VYAAYVGRQYLGDLLSTFGTETNTEKQAAVISLMQRGLDIYYHWKEGGRRPPGAGQTKGFYPPLLFWAAANGDGDTVLAEIKTALEGTGGEQQFAEIGQFQVNAGTGGAWYDHPPVWGVPTTNPTLYFQPPFTSLNYQCGESTYWKRYIQCAPGTVGKRTCEDPYGYIDGPPCTAEGSYQNCCSGGNIMATAFASHLMPAMRWGLGSNDRKFLEYMYRAKDGNKIPGFSGGTWMSPDPCAPPDENCNPTVSGDCNNYGVTWGPDGSGDCIKGSGRSNLSSSSFDAGDEPGIMKRIYPALKNCLDPTDGTYRTGACAGMPPDLP